MLVKAEGGAVSHLLGDPAATREEHICPCSYPACLSDVIRAREADCEPGDACEALADAESTIGDDAARAAHDVIVTWPRKGRCWFEMTKRGKHHKEAEASVGRRWLETLEGWSLFISQSISTDPRGLEALIIDDGLSD